jgi:phosphoglycolate phosphatase-like HAD superfamily hydrolase
MIRLVILDLDNTLYNWVDYYVPAFQAMLRELMRLTGLSEEVLTGSFKRVHQRHRTSEYAFAIEELDALAPWTQGRSVPEILEQFRSAIDAFREVRKTELRLYPGVADTLFELRRQGRRLVAHTDAMMFYAMYRLRQLGIESLFDGLVAPRDHGLPPGVLPKWVRSHQDPSTYEPRIPFVRELEPTMLKPNPIIVQEIMATFGAAPFDALYLGDSLHKDVAMAHQAGVHAVLAAYGRRCDPSNYAKLVEITHWTDEDVEVELALRRQKVEVEHQIDSFSELLGVLAQLEDQKKPLVAAAPRAVAAYRRFS